MPTANHKARTWVTLIAGLFLVAVAATVILTQGHVTGSEFSPTHFQMRDFSFYEIPVLGLQITPIKRSSSTPETAVFLRQNNYVPPPTGQPDTWHLVRITRGYSGDTPADAGMLIDPLTMTQNSDVYWKKWTTDHPKAGNVLWPQISKLAGRELYVLMPAILELAQDTTEPKKLSAAIDRYLATEYAVLVSDLHAAADAGKTSSRDVADGLLVEAIADYPDDAELKRLVAQKKSKSP